MVCGGILAGFGATAVALSLAEMASIYVTLNDDRRISAMLTNLQWIQLLGRNIVGRPILPQPIPSSGGLFKVGISSSR
jgi:hypothetical protein